MSDHHLPWLPVSVSLAGWKCLVVGAGPVATRKAGLLYNCGAAVTVVAPDLCEQMDRLVRGEAASIGQHQEKNSMLDRTFIPITFKQREYRQGEASGYRLVIAATGDNKVDYSVANDASASGALVNVADDARPSNILFPAVYRDRHVSVSVSTEGASPALASWLRNYIQRKLPPYLGVLAELLSQARRDLHDTHQSTEGIKWHDMIDEIYGTGRVDDPNDQTAWLTDQLTRPDDNVTEPDDQFGKSTNRFFRLADQAIKPTDQVDQFTSKAQKSIKDRLNSNQ